MKTDMAAADTVWLAPYLLLNRERFAVVFVFLAKERDDEHPIIAAGENVNTSAFVWWASVIMWRISSTPRIPRRK